MKKEMTYEQMKDIMEKYETENDEKFGRNSSEAKHLTGYIMVDPASFNRYYPEESRTYKISSNEKAFHGWMGGYSIFGFCEAENELLRLDGYLADEHRGGNWKIEQCWMEE